MIILLQRVYYELTAELAYIRRGWCQTWRALFEMRNHHSHSYRAGFSSHMVIHLNPLKQTLFLVFSFILSALIQRLLLSVRAIAALSFYLPAVMV